MKKELHPKYNDQARLECSCGNTTWVVGSTKDSLSVEICSSCHPFWSGEQKIVDTAITAPNTSGYESADATSTNDAVNILRYATLLNVQNLFFFFNWKIENL